MSRSKIQEDFKALGGDTLQMLAEYVEQCEAVVHFVGDMAGSTPAASSVDDLLRRRPELETRLSEKGLGQDALLGLTYTQWEAWLAIGFDKDLLIVEPDEGAARGPTYTPTDASRAAEAQHVKRLRAINRYPGPPFKNEDNLVAQVFGTAVIDALVKAGDDAARKPQNLPFASLGELFKGREKALEELRAALTGAKGAAVVGRALHGLGGRRQDAARDRIRLGARGRLFGAAVRPCRDAAALSANLAALAGASVLDLPEKEAREDAAKIEAVLRWLEGQPDVAHDPRQRGRPGGRQGRRGSLMPRLKGGHVIVTARAANFPATIRKLELDVLDEERGDAIPAGTHGRGSRSARKTTRRRPARSRANSAGSRSGSNRRARISRPTASASRAISSSGTRTATRRSRWSDRP